MNDFPDPIDGIPLLTMDSEGQVPETRLKDAASLRSIYMRFRDDDLINSQNRALTQLLLDGEPPYEDSELREAGQPDTVNINFDGASEQLERAMTPYYNLIQSPETILTTPTLYGPEEDRDELSATIGEEITRTIRDWPQFPFQSLNLCKKFVWDGVGVGHWPDSLDWRYRGSGLGQFYFPRQVFAFEDELEVACAIEEYTVTRLYNAIRNAPEGCVIYNHWNVAAVKQAIQHATSTIPNFMDWERLTDELRNNDVSIANSTPVVRVINGWVKEFDGRVSHYLTTETGSATTFLYESRCCYNAMGEALVLFPYGLGTNSKIHGIRGLGYKIYPFEQQRNRSLSRLIGQSDLASSLMLQAGDESSLQTAGMVYYGNTAVIEPGYNVVQYAAPDLQRTVMPALTEMERLRNNRTGGYSSEGVFDGNARKTKFEVSAQLEQNASLSNTALDFWYGPFERLLQQTVRRMTRRDYVPEDPGGREIADLKLRLVKRGVPLEAFYRIDIKAVKVVKAIGAGSASARTLALDRISQLRPRMDDVGQLNLDRALAIDAVGTAQANNFFPASGVRRTTADTQIAVLQNFPLLQGQEVPVLPSDRHLVHAVEHMKPLLEGFSAVEQGLAPIEEIAMQMRLLFQHTADHVDLISGDPAAAEQAAELRQQLQQIGEVISNGLRKAQAAAAEEPAEGEQAPAGPSQQEIMELESHRAKIQREQELTQVKAENMRYLAQTKAGIEDAKEAAKIARESRRPPQSP